VREGDKILFVQRAIEPRKGFWTLPGGFVELDESTEEAALRELEEETALIGRGTRLIGASTRQSKLAGAVVVIGYAVEEWEGSPVAATDAMDFGFFGRDERPEIAFETHVELLACYDAAMGDSSDS
jgi:ADP-ribose pyrophosphatase YjhB (NUDIX family)